MFLAFQDARDHGDVIMGIQHWLAWLERNFFCKILDAKFGNFGLTHQHNQELTLLSVFFLQGEKCQWYLTVFEEETQNCSLDIVQSMVATGQKKVRENNICSRSGKSRGILILIRENGNFEKSQGKLIMVRENCDFMCILFMEHQYPVISLQ